MGKKKWLATICGALVSGMLFLGGIGGAIAENFPQKAIQLVVPYGPGGGSDISCRIFAKYLQEYLPVKVVVKNVTGASGRTGEIEVKNARPDGYTLLWQHQTMHMAKICGRAENKWDEMFTPVASPIKAYSAVVVPKTSPFNTINDVIEAGRANPGKYSFGVGMLSNSHFAYLDIVHSSKAEAEDFRLIPMAGDKDRILALLQGNMDVSNVTISAAKPYLESGDLKMIGVMAENREKAFSTFPTLKEQGVAAVNRFDYTVWAPKGLPDERRKTLADALIKGSKNAELSKELDTLWISAEHYAGEQLIKKINSDFDLCAKLAKQFKISK